MAGTNFEHRRRGVALLVPTDVHHGHAEQLTAARAAVLDAAFQQHPQRFVRKPPEPPRLSRAVWISKPVNPQSRLSNFPRDLSQRA